MLSKKLNPLFQSINRFLVSNGIPSIDNDIYFVVLLVILLALVKLFMTMLRYIILALIVLMFALAITLPPTESFDAKRELKRVIRDERTVDNVTEKPGFFERAFRRAEASVTGEILSIAGYKVSIDTYYNLINLSKVTYSATNSTCIWVGCFNKWYFIGNFHDESKKSN